METGSPLQGFGPAAAPEAAPEGLELRPAKINDRFIAYLLDFVPFVVGCIVSLYVIVLKLNAAEPTPEFVRLHTAAWVGLLVLYQWVGNCAGGTIGKKLMGLAVVRKDGEALGAARGLVRAAGYLLSTPFFNFGFVIALFHPESRALHDLLSGSLVVESRPKPPAESFVLFLGAMLAMVGLFGGNIFFQLNAETARDRLAVAKAEEGLEILAQCQEAYKAQNGHYTQSLGDLAGASGDVEQFKKAMLEIFQADLFRVEATLTGYTISAAAKDHRKTRVAISGPAK